MRRLLAPLLAAGLFVSAVPAQAATGPTGSEVGKAEQVIVVTAPNTSARMGTLEAFELKDGDWVRVLGPVAANLGFGGLVAGDQRRQGTGKTPIGTYEVVNAFGRDADPGTALPYRRIDRNDVWTFNRNAPSTYNLFQSVNRSWKSYGERLERLWEFGKQYDLVAVLDYNLPDPKTVTTGRDGVRRTSKPADTDRGGGIFIHASNGKNTAGCVAIAKPKMRELMQWMDPAKKPTTVIRIG